MKTKVFLAMALMIAIIAVAFAQDEKEDVAKLPNDVSEWEIQAEQGDTVALHKLLRYLNDNSDYVVYVEVVQVVSADGEDITDEASNDNTTEHDEEFADLCSERLEYWLAKGLAVNDPVAISIKGQRDYFYDEESSIESLVKAVEVGDNQAALFCGSACFNQGRYAEAIKYLMMAYDAGIPSAGWHLAMCYSEGLGVEKDNSKAIEFLRHSAMMDYPEAVLEMKRIEPSNPVWKHKADSIEIDFPDFPIIED